MGTRDWDSTYEATPANTAKRHEGDDRMRDIKLDVRETLQQGGHDYPGAGTGAPLGSTDNERGRHMVDAGGSGVSPTIYKSDGVTPLVEPFDDRVEHSEAIHHTGLRGSITTPATSGNTILTYDDFFIDCSGAIGAQTLTLPAYADPSGHWRIYKERGYSLALATDGGVGTFNTKRGPILEIQMVFPAEWLGFIHIWQKGTDNPVVDWDGPRITEYVNADANHAFSTLLTELYIFQTGLTVARAVTGIPALDTVVLNAPLEITACGHSVGAGVCGLGAAGGARINGILGATISATTPTTNCISIVAFNQTVNPTWWARRW